MTDKPVKYHTRDLEREIELWLNILNLWLSHLSFLKIRIEAVQRPEIQALLQTQKETLLNKINFLCDSVISDYIKSLEYHKEYLEGGINRSWLEDHSGFRKHIKKLSTEYRGLINDILSILELKKVDTKST